MLEREKVEQILKVAHVQFAKIVILVQNQIRACVLHADLEFIKALSNHAH